MLALRKRVLPKSPVRKIRTPGSERGLPGNWLSYRDNVCKTSNYSAHTDIVHHLFLDRVKTTRHVIGLPPKKHELAYENG